jgi:hypothetical protein
VRINKSGKQTPPYKVERNNAERLSGVWHIR